MLELSHAILRYFMTSITKYAVLITNASLVTDDVAIRYIAN